MTDPIDILLSIPGIVIFNISDKEFCADIRQVYKILKVNESENNVSELSDHAKYICINDIKIPIIDLHKFFGLKKQKKTSDTRVLFIEVNNAIYGFIVEKIHEFVTISRRFNIGDVNSIQHKNKFFLKGILEYEGRQLSLPDFQKIDKAIHSIPEAKLENQRAT